MQQGIKKEKGW